MRWFVRGDIDGFFGLALEHGFIFTSMVLAAAWFAGGAALSLVGLIHSYVFTPGDTAGALVPGFEWAIGYGAMAAIMLLARWITTPADAGH